MGCFNKSCVVTGLQITYGDPIVGIKLAKTEHNSYHGNGVDFDHIKSEWYPIEFPIRGIYDDYGRIEVDGKLYEGDEDKDYDNTRCDDYMFIHEWAYDHILEVAQKERDDWCKRYEGQDWAFKREREDWEHIRSALDDISSSVISEMSIRAVMEGRTGSYFAIDNRNYWFPKLYQKGMTFDELKANIERFSKELGSLEDWRHEFGFQWHPSYVANQEVYEDYHIGLFEKGIEYLKESRKKYEEHDYN